jgi:hypothetical protein
VVLPEPTPFGSPGGGGGGGGGDDDVDALLAELAASEDRLNAARSGAAAGQESAASVQRMLGPQSATGQGQSGAPTGGGAAGAPGGAGDTDLDELDDLLEEFL